MPLVTIINPHGALETAPPVNVNGTSYAIAYGRPIDLPEAAIAALRHSTLAIVEHDTPSPASAPAGNGDAAGGAEPGGETPAGSESPEDDGPPADESGDAFDPEAIIAGSVDDVADRLGDLTLDQLDRVAAAEIDREQPRAGVAKAIERARKAFTGD